MRLYFLTLSYSVKEAQSVSRIVSSNFYIEVRMGVCWPRRSLAEKIPRFTTREAWLLCKSTKFDICARMCEHLLTHDDVPDMLFQDGTAVFPEIPEPRIGQKITCDRKIILYQEFPSLGGLLRNVSILARLHLHRLTDKYRFLICTALNTSTSTDRYHSKNGQILSKGSIQTTPSG